MLFLLLLLHNVLVEHFSRKRVRPLFELEFTKANGCDSMKSQKL